ncbi:hypothetical protein [Pseudomonas sp.]|uniref:hypothetical protein n=1 Tax=Pseudomonas sp. TaxID=306 RepID=UPI003A97A1A7
MVLQLTWIKATTDLRRQIVAIVCHAVACLLFPLATAIGFKVNTAVFTAPLTRSVGIGMASYSIWCSFVLSNWLIALINKLLRTVALISAQAITVLIYLLPQHPLRAAFFADPSGVLKSLGFSVLICLSILGGCTAQPKTVFIANLENICSYPVSVIAHEYSNAKDPFVLEKHLKPSESTEVLSYISFSDDIENSFPETYQLDIEANGRALSFNKPKLLQLLKQSDYHLKGNTIHTWKISDKTLCPYTQFSRRN